VPLSEEELRLLEQMERALTEEDPKFASTLRGTTMRNAARRNAFVAALGLVIGIAVLMTGVITHYWQIGIVGFVIMLGAATLGLTALRGQRVGPAAYAPTTSEAGRRQHPSGFAVVDGGRRNRHPARRPAFMDTVRARWRRRRDIGGW
jgi:hypothetical protein